jgi:hypothetical protein
MVKQVTVTFEFDPETELVSNVHAFVDGVEKKKTTTRKAPTKEIIMEAEAIIVREDNKLVLNNKCAATLEVKAEDRLVIKYEKIGKKRVPIVGTDLAFGEEGSGNKVTKSNTVTYRGKANTVLAEYGVTFKLEEYKPGIWKLVSDDMPPKDEEEAQEMAEEVEANLYTQDDDTTEIDELTFKL